MINYQSKDLRNDLLTVYDSISEWKIIKDKIIMVTGATGMIASYFTFMLMYLNEQKGFNIKLILLARKREKLRQLFGEESENVIFKTQDVCKEIDYNGKIDFIFHAAGAASPYYILNDPVGIIKANTIGTINVLELARKVQTQKVIFTSTREVYGTINEKNTISEEDMGVIDPLNYRSCYPESKRMAENIIESYSLQYQIEYDILRIAHVYGPGIQIHNDGRVMGDLLHDAINNKKIYLKSNGKSIRSFCYVTDAIEAIFRILTDGKKNEVYNIANETEPVTVFKLAQLIQETLGKSEDDVIASSESAVQGYCNYPRVKLDTSKIENLGWKPKISLAKGLKNTMQSLINQ